MAVSIFRYSYIFLYNLYYPALSIGNLDVLGNTICNGAANTPVRFAAQVILFIDEIHMAHNSVQGGPAQIDAHLSTE